MMRSSKTSSAPTPSSRGATTASARLMRRREDTCVRKVLLGDLDVCSPERGTDWRISARPRRSEAKRFCQCQRLSRGLEGGQLTHSLVELSTLDSPRGIEGTLVQQQTVNSFIQTTRHDPPTVARPASQARSTPLQRCEGGGAKPRGPRHTRSSGTSTRRRRRRRTRT
ncbi:hypothetical protein BKA93DRAFT_218703 [Sparassis latifolia]